MSKLFEKTIALILIIILVSANLIILGEHTMVYALSEDELNKQSTSTNHKNVEFNSYFEGNKHIQTFDIDDENAKIYLNIIVKNDGYLEDSVVEFQNANFKLKDEIKNENIQSVDVKNNRITLNRLNSESNVTIELPIEILKADQISLDYFNKEMVTKFTSKYIDKNGKEKNIEKEITNKLLWYGKAEVKLKVEPTKYVPYATENNYGVMLQTKINSSIEDNKLPINSTNIEITVPKINNMNPTSVNVIAINTEATNGKTDGLDFNNSNYTYDLENGKVTINTKNLVNNSNNVYWKQNVTDEYLVTYLFEGQDIYNYANTNGIDSKAIVNANISVFNNNETVVNANTVTDIKYTEKNGNINNFELYVPNDISKGQIYANYDAQTKLETEYYTKYIATIDNAKLTNSIEFIQEYDNFLTDNNEEGSTTIGNDNYSYNKRIEISQSGFNKMLGEEGNIIVKDDKSIEIGRIDKNSTLENGLYCLDISSNNSNRISITTTKPITEGQLEINIVKAIKGDIDYSKEQVETFSKMKMGVEGKTDTTTVNVWKQTLLREPELKAELQIDKRDWTTAMKNENIEIKAVLDTSNKYNDLFRNPVIQIEFPNVVEKIEVKNIKLLYTDEIKIKEAKLNNVNGKYVLNLVTEGIQTTYNIGEAVKGINIVINANIILKEKISTQTTEVKMYYMNTDSKINTYSNNSNENRKQSTVKVNAISQTGIITENGMSGISDNTNISSIENEKKTGIINTYSDKRTSTVYGKVINSYNNPIKDLVVLGRVPVQGNKKIDTNEELGSNFNLSMKSKVSIVGLEKANILIYYSEKVDATREIEEVSNGWTTTPKNLADVKSYMIVISNYDILQGEELEFKYDVEIPENLDYGKASYEMYKVYYNNVTEVGTLTETKESPIIGVTTGEEPKLEVKLSSNFEQNAEVREKQIVKFFASIKNTGDAKVEDVILHITAPEGTSHIKYLNNGYDYQEDSVKTKKINVGNIEKGETKEVPFELKMLEDENNNEDKNNIVFQVGATSSKNQNQVISNEYVLEKTKGVIALFVTPNKTQNSALKAKDAVEMTVNIENMSGENIKNVVVTSKIPKGITIEDAYFRIDGNRYDENVKISDDKVEATIPEMEAFSDITFIYRIRINDYIGKLTTLISATADGVNTHYSNEVIHNVDNIKMEIKQTSDTPKYILEGEEIVYKYEVKNTGKVEANSVTIENKIPDGLEFVSAKYEYRNTTNVINSNNDDVFSLYLIRF